MIVPRWIEVYPLGFVTGPFSFNIDLDDLFYIDMNYEIANHADDNHLYHVDSCTITLKNALYITVTS